MTVPLTKEELLSLTEIGDGMVFGTKPLPVAHLAKFLRLGFIKAEGDCYVATISGRFLLAHGA